MQEDQPKKYIEWNAEYIEFLRQRYCVDGAKRAGIHKEIREKFGVDFSRQGVSAAIRRYFPDHVKRNTAETQGKMEERRALAKRLNASGLTPREVADEMGEPMYRVYDWLPQSGRMAFSNTPTGMFEAFLRGLRPLPVPPDLIVTTGHNIADLNREDCRWPIGKDADGKFRFCGCRIHRQPNQRAISYCPEHLEMSVRRPVKKHKPTLQPVMAKAA